MKSRKLSRNQRTMLQFTQNHAGSWNSILPRARERKTARSLWKEGLIAFNAVTDQIKSTRTQRGVA